MTDIPRDPDDPLADPLDVKPDEDHLTAYITTPIRSQPGDPFGLEWSFLCWAWETNHRDWDKALRTLARALRGLEGAGLIERRRIRIASGGVHHGFVLSEDGRLALLALSGDWIEQVNEGEGNDHAI